jgi:hypothetical protein
VLKKGYVTSFAHFLKFWGQSEGKSWGKVLEANSGHHPQEELEPNLATTGQR